MVYRCLREPGAILKQLWKLGKVSAHGKALYILYAGDGLFSSGSHVFCTLWQDFFCFSALLSEDAVHRRLACFTLSEGVCNFKQTNLQAVANLCCRLIGMAHLLIQRLKLVMHLFYYCFQLCHLSL